MEKDVLFKHLLEAFDEIFGLGRLAPLTNLDLDLSLDRVRDLLLNMSPTSHEHQRPSRPVQHKGYLPYRSRDLLFGVVLDIVSDNIDLFLLSCLSPFDILHEEVDLLLQITLHRPYRFSDRAGCIEGGMPHHRRAMSIARGGLQVYIVDDFFAGDDIVRTTRSGM